MAKLSNVRAMVQDDVRRVRMRYNQALEAGYTTAEASAHANGDAVLVPKTKSIISNISESGPTKFRDTKPLGLSGKRVQEPEPETIPVVEEISNLREALSEKDVDVIKGIMGPPATTLDPKPIEKIKTTIPKDWPDLPWPQLQKLAESLSGGEVKSRKHANKIIEKASR